MRNARCSGLSTYWRSSERACRRVALSTIQRLLCRSEGERMRRDGLSGERTSASWTKSRSPCIRNWMCVGRMTMSILYILSPMYEFRIDCEDDDRERGQKPDVASESVFPDSLRIQNALARRVSRSSHFLPFPHHPPPPPHRPRQRQRPPPCSLALPPVPSSPSPASSPPRRPVSQRSPSSVLAEALASPCRSSSSSTPTSPSSASMISVALPVLRPT